MDLWLVGKINREDHAKWEFMGIFDMEDQALSICVEPGYFIGPVILNQACPVERTTWPGAYYPMGTYE